MGRMIYNVILEPTGAEYVALVKFLARIAARFMLVRRATIGLSDSGQRVIRALQPYKLSEGDEASWPGTQLLNGQTATVYRFVAAPQAIDIVCHAAERLFAWQQPALPEDLCFEDVDGLPLLSTISHEADAQLQLSEEDYHRLQTELPFLVEYLEPADYPPT